MTKHISVFRKEVIENLEIKPTGIYADLTLGGGGHASDLLSKLNGGALVVFDIDIRAIERFASTLKVEKQEDIVEGITKVTSGNNFIYLANRNFEELDVVLKQLNLEKL